MSDLQRKIARRREEEEAFKALVAAHNSKPYPRSAAAWQKASEDALNGTWKARPPWRMPVILTLDGPISSPLQLQALAETESVPQVTVTTRVAREGGEIEKVKICDISREEW